MHDPAFELHDPAFAVVAEPRRRSILELLVDGERPVGELATALGASQPAVSKHLAVLRRAGWVESRVDGPRRLYRLRPEPLAAIDRWLAPFRARWGTQLDTLAAHLGADEAAAP